MAPTGVSGLFYGGGFSQLGKQAVGVAVVGIYAFVLSAVLGFVIERTVGFRVDRDDELSGVDLAIHAETAYELHTVATGRASSHGLLSTLTSHREDPL